MFIIQKYVKIMCKKRAPPCYFLEAQRWRILQKLNLRDYFFNILGFILYAVSCAKTDSHSKYILNFVFGSFLERDHLLNLFILKGYATRWAKCVRISKQKLKTIHWGKKYWITGLVSEKTEALYVELNETVLAANSSYSATGKFLR